MSAGTKYKMIVLRQMNLEGPGPGFEPGSWDPQSQRITTTPSGPSFIKSLKDIDI